MQAGVYIHIPFCKSRCSYCDFATDVYRSGAAVDRYVSALLKEISTFPGILSVAGRRGLQTVDTIYFGGGTPSLLTPDHVDRILNAVFGTFSVDPNAEMTMEMNPATVTAESLNAYRSLGVNRASFGVQTFDDTELKRLARGHTADDARNTFRMLREAGFENISFDLIAGLPVQTLGDWEGNLYEALELPPEHLSLYLLEIHEGTPLAEQIRSGRQPLPDEDLTASMYELMIDKVAADGYVQYEISNFARPGFESRHNSKYWRLFPVYGFGVSAHSFDGYYRYSNERDTAHYVRRIEQGRSAAVFREAIDEAAEFAFLGLRMNKGIDMAAYRNRFGVDVLGKLGADLDRLSRADLLEVSDGTLRLTPKGMLFSNEVFAALV